MTSGYLVTEEALGKDILGFPVAAAQPEAWDFLRVQPFMVSLAAASPLQKRLKVADKLAFRCGS